MESLEDMDNRTQIAEQETLDAIPDEIREWMLHLDLHVTEHDLNHAGLALRAGWPAVRDYMLYLISHRLHNERRDAIAKKYGE